MTTYKCYFFRHLYEIVNLCFKRLYESNNNELMFLQCNFKQLCTILTCVNVYGFSHSITMCFFNGKPGNIMKQTKKRRGKTTLQRIQNERTLKDYKFQHCMRINLGVKPSL